MGLEVFVETSGDTDSFVGCGFQLELSHRNVYIKWVNSESVIIQSFDSRF